MDVFGAVAEPRRRRIIELLARRGELSAGEICRSFEVTAQAVSQHLRILLDARIVRMEKRAQQRIYSIDPGSIREVEQWASRVEGLWTDSLDRLAAVLDEEKGVKKRR